MAWSLTLIIILFIATPRLLMTWVWWSRVPTWSSSLAPLGGPATQLLAFIRKLARPLLGRVPVTSTRTGTTSLLLWTVRARVKLLTPGTTILYSSRLTRRRLTTLSVVLLPKVGTVLQLPTPKTV